MSLLLDFLTNRNISDIEKRIEDGEPLYKISDTYPGLNRSERAALWYHMRIKRNPLPKNNLGSKDVAYYEDEEEQMALMPKYTWESLSKEEKEFYKNKK